MSCKLQHFCFVDHQPVKNLVTGPKYLPHCVISGHPFIFVLFFVRILQHDLVFTLKDLKLIVHILNLMML